MGLEIVLQTESGAKVDSVADPKNYLASCCRKSTTRATRYWEGSILTEIPSLTASKYAASFWSGKLFLQTRLRQKSGSLFQKSNNWPFAAVTRSIFISDSLATDRCVSPRAARHPIST